MNHKGLRRWAWLGALAAVVGLGSACGRGETVTGQEKTRAVPREGTRDEALVNTGQPLESFGPQPGTGGSGQQGQPMTPAQAQQKAPDEAWGLQGKQGGIGAPGFSTPRETGTLPGR